jgi:hypothetical protein
VKSTQRLSRTRAVHKDDIRRKRHEFACIPPLLPDIQACPAHFKASIAAFHLAEVNKSSTASA